MKEVFVSYSTVNIPTYSWDGEDREPSLIREFAPRGQPIYPYTAQERIAGKSELKTYDTVVLENEFLKLTFIPGMNGRLYSAFDKVNGREVFYNNPQFKPSLFGLRGAWCANGVEYNFPNSHSTTTLERIEFKVVNNSDGSVSCICGDCERVGRMLWSVETILRPGSAAIEMISKLYNRTEYPKRFYYWMNAAVPLYPETQFIYPESTKRLYTHPPMDISRIAYLDYPVHNGADISRFKNIPQHFPVFAENMDEDFFGVYHHHLACGLVHVADHALVRGRKIWMFGNARDGKIWIDLLTDSGVDYCEVQTGPFSLQSDYRPLQPGKMHVQKDLWMPVGPLGGFNAASAKIAANISRHPQKADIKLSAAARLDNCMLYIKSGEKVIAEQSISLDALKIKELSVSGDFTKDFNLEIIGKNGSQLLFYSSDKGKPDEEDKHPISPGNKYVEGKYWEEQGWPSRAYEIYLSDNSAESIVAGARMDMDSGLFDKASDALHKRLESDPENPEALLYAGICLKKTGRFMQSEKHLSRCRDDARYIQDATLQLAELSMIRHRYCEASERLEYLLENYENTPMVLALAAIAYRKNGNMKVASGFLAEAEKIMPFEPLLYGEKFFLGETGISEGMRDQMLLETVTSYMNINEYEDALEILNAYINSGKDTPPLFLYYKNYLEKSEKLIEHASECKWNFVFRSESEEVLKYAIEKDPDDSATLYHLGNFYAFKRRWTEALDCWRKVSGECRSLALRGQGLYWWKIGRDTDKALESYAGAASLENCGVKTLWEYDHLLAETGKISLRTESLRKHETLAASDNRLLLRKADALVNGGHPEEALEILLHNKFPLCEGKILPRLLYEDACWQIAEEFRKKKEFDKALTYLMKPLEYPENLGVGKPAANMESEWYWRCGKICLEMDNSEKAGAFFKKGAEAGDGISIDFFPLKELVWTHDADIIDVHFWMNIIFRAACCKELGINNKYKEFYSSINSFVTKKINDGRQSEPEVRLLRTLIDSLLAGKRSENCLKTDKISYSRMIKTIMQVN